MPYEIRTYNYDKFDFNPREDASTLMICFHRRYNLGDEHAFKSADYRGWSEMEGDIIRKLKPAFIAPLFMYDHSALDISTGIKPTWWHANWDAGQIGFIVLRKKEARQLAKLYGRTLTQDDFDTLVKGELEDYVMYLNGWQEYGYDIVDTETGQLADEGGSGYDSEEDAIRDAEAHIEIIKQDKGELVDSTFVTEQKLLGA